MNKTVMIVFGGIFAIIFMIVAVCATSYISATNYGASIESQLKAARDDNKNVLAQYEQKILEATQVPSMYKNDYKEVVTGALQNRYGNNGANAMMLWIKEHDINFDSSLYTKLQQMIESGRNDFKNNQTKMIDIRRGYETQLNFFWRGTWLRIAGYPKLNLADYQPVITDRTEDAFANNKESSPLTLR
jgi:hypothetical protein